MKKILLMLVVGVFFSFASVPQASAQFGRQGERGGDRVCFYQDIRFNGWEQCYRAGDEVANLEGRSNSISSIRIYGRARVTVYSDKNFRGASAEFTNDVPDLGLRSMSGSKSWSDRIQSIRIEGGGNYGGGGGGRDQGNPPFYGRTQEPQDGICIYDQTNFRGRAQCWRVGESIQDLARLGNWSDRISSIRLFGRSQVVLFRDVGFRGESLVIDRDVPDLGQYRIRGGGSWNNQVSSMQIETERRGRGRGRGWYR